MIKLTYKIPVLVHDDEGNRYSELDTNSRVLDICCDAFNGDHVLQYLDVPVYSGRMLWNEKSELLVDLYFLDTVWEAYPYWIERCQEQLDGQLSDGWGEAFEQFSYMVNGQEVYISVWDKDNHAEFIDRKAQ